MFPNYDLIDYRKPVGASFVQNVMLSGKILLRLLVFVLGLEAIKGAESDEFPIGEEFKRNAVVVSESPDFGGASESLDDGSRNSASKRQKLLFAGPSEMVEGKSGKALIALKYPEKESIEFEIIHPKDLRVQETVRIPAGETQVMFRIKALDDDLINLNRNARISIRIGFTYFATIEVTIHDDEKPPRLSVSHPPIIQEGMGKFERVDAKVHLDRAADVDIPLHVICSPRGELLVDDMVIPAGSKSAVLGIRPIQENKLTGDKNLVLRVVPTRDADSIKPWQGSLLLVDDEKFELKLNLSNEVIEGVGGNELVGIGGEWVKDVVVQLSCDHPEWLELPGAATVFTGETKANFEAKVLDVSAGEDERWVTITATTPGFASASASIRIRETKEAGLSRKFDEGAKDLVWDPTRNLIYASVPAHQYVLSGEPIAYISAVIAIDPVTLEVKDELSMFDPGQLKLSADGKHLYVNSGRSKIQRIRLEDFVVDHVYPVGAGEYPALRLIQDFCLVESRPGTIVTAVWWYKDSVANKFGGYEVSDESGIVVMASPIPLSEWIPFLVEPTADPDVVYGIMPDRITRFRVGEGTLTEVDHVSMGYEYQQATGSYSPSWNDVQFDGQGALIFDFTGMSMDGDTLQFLGSYGQRFAASCVDHNSNRVFGVDSGGAIQSFDRASLMSVRSLQLSSEILPYGNYPEPCLIRWGHDGLAFATSDRVVLVNNSWLVPGDPTTDLKFEWSAAPNPVTVGESVKCTIKVHNEGESTAENAEINVKFSSIAEISSTSSSVGKSVIGSNSIKAKLGDMAPGSSASVEVVVSCKSPGVIQSFAGVVSDAAEQDWANNGANGEIPVLFDPTKNVNDLQIHCADIVGDPQGTKVWIAVTADSEWQNMILAMDPTDGSILRRIPLPCEPAVGTLSISDDSRYLFVASAWSGEICRIDLSKGNDAREIYSAGSFSRISDLVVVDAAVPVYVVTGTANGTGMQAVCDGNVVRPKVLYYTPEFITLMALSPGRNSVFMVEAGGGYELTLSGAGLTSTRLWNNSVSNLGGLELVGQHLINGSGDVFDMWTGNLVTKVGTGGFPLFHHGSGRAWMLGNTEIAAFEPDTWNATGRFSWKYQYATKYVGWGANGLACRVHPYLIRFLKIPVLIPAAVPFASMATSASQNPADQDGDGTPDVMEEIFGNSAAHADANPVRGEILFDAGRRIVRLHFARREGVLPSRYEYQVSADMKRWTVPGEVKEVVTSRFNKSGVNVEEIQADVLMPDGPSGFVRLASPR